MKGKMLCFIQQTAADDQRLPADPTELGLLPVEPLTQLEITVDDFQEADIFQIQQARCTGRNAFCNSGARNNWGWGWTSGEDSYGDWRGQAVLRLLALFKLGNMLSEAGRVYQVGLFGVLDHINRSRFHPASGHRRVSKRSTSLRHANSHPRGSN